MMWDEADTMQGCRDSLQRGLRHARKPWTC
jgi:hypothetical protein